MMRFSCTIAALMMLLGSQAWGNYYVGFNDWNSLSVEGKQNYVAGVLDLLVQKTGQDEMFREGLEHCRFEGLGVPEDVVADMIDALYRDHVGLHKESPAMVAYLVVLKRCQSMIDSFMIRAGESPPSFQKMLRDLATPAGAAPQSPN